MKECAFHNFFIDKIQHLYWTEKHFVDSLSIIKEATSSDNLKNAFQSNIDQIHINIARIETIFDLLNEKIEERKCHAMAGILNQINCVISETVDKSALRDAGLIIAAKEANRYKITAYTNLLEFSKIMEDINVSQILLITLKEEKEINQKLLKLAETSIDNIMDQCR